MSYTYVKPGLARLLVLAMEHDFPDRIEVWKGELEQNRLTTEMRSVFEAMGYEVPRTRHVKKQTEPEDVTVEAINEREAEARDGIFSADEMAPRVDHPLT